MTLDADRVDRHVTRLQPVEQLQHRGPAPFAAWRVMFDTIIGQEQGRLGVGLARGVEGDVDIMFAQRLHPHAVGAHPVGTAVIGLQRLVHHVPFLDAAGIAGHGRGDIARHQFPAAAIAGGLQCGFQPFGLGGIPDQGMAARAHVMLLGEIDDLVGTAEIILARLGLGRAALQLIFLHQDVAFLRHRLGEAGILAQLTRLDRRAEIAALGASMGSEAGRHGGRSHAGGQRRRQRHATGQKFATLHRRGLPPTIWAMSIHRSEIRR